MWSPRALRCASRSRSSAPPARRRWGLPSASIAWSAAPARSRPSKKCNATMEYRSSQSQRSMICSHTWKARRNTGKTCAPLLPIVNVTGSRLMLSARIAVTVACALLFAAPAAAQKLYKYVDSNGKVVYTDKPPIEATGKASEQLSPQGTVVKRNQAPLTAEQRAALAEESKRKAEEQIRAKEEKRKNEALLNTYSSEQDIDQARERALKANDATIKDTERKLAEAQKRQQQLKSETDF